MCLTGPPPFLAMTERTKDALWLAVVTGLFLFVALLAVCSARADYTVAFTASWCRPCRLMEPIEQQLVREGHDLRIVDIDRDPEMRAAFGVTRVPCFIRVAQTPYGDHEVGRINGTCTAAQLRRLSVMPGVVTVGAAVRSTVRSILGVPVPILPGW